MLKGMLGKTSLKSTNGVLQICRKAKQICRQVKPLGEWCPSHPPVAMALGPGNKIYRKFVFDKCNCTGDRDVVTGNLLFVA